MLFRKCGCLVAHEKCIFRKCFSVDLCWDVKWFPFLFYLQISFSGKQRERAEWEGDRAHTQREREREEEETESRNRLRRTQKTQDRARSSSNAQTHWSNPENPFDRTISDPHRTDYTTSEIVAPPHRSTQNQSFSSYPKTDRPRPRFVVLDRDLAFMPITIAAPCCAISPLVEPSRLSLFLLLSIWPDYDFFFFGFYLCFWIEEWNYIFVWQLRKCEKCEQQVENMFSMVFSTTQPNTRKYFSQHFLKYNQTLKNIFLSGK